MDNSAITHILLLALSGALIFSLISDLKHRKIYNVVTLAIALGAPAYWFALGEPIWPHMVFHIAVAAGFFITFAILFQLGMMGGGDVKLLAALALWFPFMKILELLLFTSIIGLAVTLIFWISHRRQKLPGQPRIPYGIAISLAALWVISEPYFNHFG